MADETKIIRIVIDASRAVDGSRAATAAWERMERAQASAAGSMDRMEVALGRVGGFLKAQIALQVSEIGSRFLAMAKASLDAAAGLGELADQMGITTQGLQALQFSAVQNGVKLEQLETGVAKFSQKMGEAADGSKEMIEALDRIGVRILDARGQLRPTELLLGDVARAITSIDEPAKQTAAAVDFFGKAGAKMIPTLRDLASGMDAMQARAKAAGAVISDDTIAKLDALADRSSVAALRWRALIAEVVAPVVTEGLERINTMLGEIISQLERGRASGKGFWETVLNDSKASGRIGSGPNALRLATPEELDALRREKLQKELAVNADDPMRRQMVQDDLDRLNRRSIIDRQAEADSQETWARRFKPAEVTAPGVSNPGIKGAGQSEAEAIAKARRDAIRDRDAQLEYAEASEKGARAVADLETHFKALKAAQDAYGKTADDNKAGVAALTAELERLMSAADKARNLKDFNLGTTELEKSNELLEAENRLINESVETRAHEIALIKLRQEVEGKGIDASNEKERVAIERREAAITQNERLKAQGEEIRKANELWTEPLKQALRDLQQAGTDAWDRILQTGKLDFESLADVFRTTIRRMAAEFLALATIRPVMSVMVQGLGAVGLVSPATASQLGYGTAGGSSMTMPGFSGLGGGSFGGMLGSVGEWLNTPLTGPYAGLSPSAMAGVPTLSPSLVNPSSWGITPLAGAGAALGVGSGIYQLLSGGGSTRSTVGGISSIAGGLASLIPGVGWIAGPAIAILGNLLGGLFGDSYQLPPLAGAQASWAPGRVSGMNGWTTNGGQAITGQYADQAAAMQSIYDRLGGVSDPAKIWGAAVWQNYREGQTTSYVIDPSGNSTQWGQGSGDQSGAVSTASAHAAINSILGGAIKNVSDNLRQALGSLADKAAPTLEQLDAIVTQIKAFDEALAGFDKTVTDSQKAVEQIDANFKSLYDTAKTYGLATGTIDTQVAKQKLGVATDFRDALQRQLDDLVDPTIWALNDLDKWKKSLVDNNAWLIENVAGAQDQILKIEELYAKKRAAILDQTGTMTVQAMKSAAESLLGIVQDLTYGGLSGASPVDTLGGTRGTFLATMAQAQAGSATAINRLGSDASAYVQAARAYYGTTADYAAIVDQVRQALTEEASSLQTGGGLAPAAAADQASSQLIQSNLALTRQIADQNVTISRLMQQIADLTAQMQRLAVNRAA